jgi:hypothetical protein
VLAKEKKERGLKLYKIVIFLDFNDVMKSSFLFFSFFYETNYSMENFPYITRKKKGFLGYKLWLLFP